MGLSATLPPFLEPPPADWVNDNGLDWRERERERKRERERERE